MERSDGTYWALILGGSQGLGKATALKLAQEGYHLIIVHRDRKADMEEIDRFFASLRALGVRVLALNKDALSAEKQQELISEIKNGMPERHIIKIVVHSIAKGSLKGMGAAPGGALGLADLQITANAMAYSLYTWVQLLRKEDLLHTDTRVIAFTSEGNKRVLPNYGAVSVAKAALEALVRQMAVEMAPYGIKTNCVQAGVTETASFALIPGSGAIKEHALKRNPSGRLTVPADVAKVVYLLSREEARWINGAIIPVDGGEHLR